MSAVLISLLLFSVTAGMTEAVEYTDTKVVREKVILYENPRFVLQTVGTGNDSFLFMKIKDPITVADNFSLSVVAKRFDGVEFPIAKNPIKLCQLLSDEATNADGTLTQFRMSRIFNMEGMTCPIPAGMKRLMPYMFPPKLSLYNDIGCGTFTYETTIESCQGQKPENCMPFITASTDVFLSGDHCSNTLM